MTKPDRPGRSGRARRGVAARRRGRGSVRGTVPPRLTSGGPLSHHLDTPEAAERGQLFLDDLFVFDGEQGTVFVVDVNTTVTGEHASPDFWPGARYELHVHTDGAEQESLVLRVVFGEPEAGGQSVRLEAVTGAGDGSADELLLEGRTGEAVTAGDLRLWAGRAKDPFYFDLSLLEPISSAVTGGSSPDLSGWDPAQAENTFGDTTVASIVLEVPHGFAGLTPGTRTAVWAATKLSDGEGGFRQVNRGGLPMMWPIFWPDDTDFSNPANFRHPSQDVAADRNRFAQMLTASAKAGSDVGDPEAFGQQVADQLVPDVLPYEIGTPAQFGAKVRNGRSFVDNAPQVMLSLVTGTQVDAGLTDKVAAANRTSSFPYVVPA